MLHRGHHMPLESPYGSRLATTRTTIRVSIGNYRNHRTRQHWQLQYGLTQYVRGNNHTVGMRQQLYGSVRTSKESDFTFLSQNGINAVRIPVGWWIASDPNPLALFVGGSLKALDNAFFWAKYISNFL
ncbi:hypothetical protein SUGI_0037590 [Cryptomeria japonica]|nr:hypothetical protein SUGI_0037590 [Cryptomeria japonica]